MHRGVASSALYDGLMRWDEDTKKQLVEAAASVRSVEEDLEAQRVERDAEIWRAAQEGYSLGDIAEVTGLAKSTIALIVKIEGVRQSALKDRSDPED